jgi:TP901-1 family phage major tail protein
MADVKDGHLVRVYIGGVAVAKETEANIKLSLETKDISHKDISGSWSDVDGGKLSGEISGSNLYAEAESFESLWTAFSTKAGVVLRFSDEVQGNKCFEGTFLITSLEQTAADNESVTFSWSASNQGAITRETVS